MISIFFQAFFFFGRTNLKLIEKHDKVLGVRGAYLCNVGYLTPAPAEPTFLLYSIIN